MNELVKTSELGNLPDYLKDHTGPTGMESLGQGDYKTPRVLLLQALNPECRAFPGRAIPGEFWHNAANVSLGKEFKFVAGLVSKRAILFRPRWEGGGILAFSSDAIKWDTGGNKDFNIKPNKDSNEFVTWKTGKDVASSGLNQFGSFNPAIENSPPALVGIYEYMIYLPDFPHLSPCLLSCSKTALPNAKQLNTTYAMLGKKPISSVVIKVHAQEKSENNNTWYVPSFQGVGWASAETYKEVSEYAKKYSNYKADYEHENEVKAATTGIKDSDEIPF